MSRDFEVLYKGYILGFINTDEGQRFYIEDKNGYILGQGIPNIDNAVYIIDRLNK